MTGIRPQTIHHLIRLGEVVPVTGIGKNQQIAAGRIIDFVGQIHAAKEKDMFIFRTNIQKYGKQIQHIGCC